MQQEDREQQRGFSQDLPALEEWLQSSLARQVVDVERNLLDEILPKLFGYRILQMGVSPHLCLFESSEAGHRFISCPDAGARPDQGFLCSENNGLALASESVDIVLLHHVLDFDPNPHQVLREAARVAISGGTLVIVGFNPWSLFGMRRHAWLRAVPGQGGFISHARLADWMTLLDLHPDHSRHGFYRPPVQHSGLLGSLGWMDKLGEKLKLPFGGIYVTVAKKHPHGTTPLLPEWRKRRVILPGMAPRFADSLRKPCEHG